MNFITDTEAQNKKYLAQHPFFQRDHYYLVTKDIPAAQRNSGARGTISKGSVLLFSGANAENKTMTMINCEYASGFFSVVYYERDEYYYSIQTKLLEETLKDCDDELTSIFHDAEDSYSKLHNELEYGHSKKEVIFGVLTFIMTLISFLMIFIVILVEVKYDSHIYDNHLSLVDILGIIAIVVSAVIAGVFYIFHKKEAESYQDNIRRQINDNEKSAKQRFEEYICSVIGEN